MKITNIHSIKNLSLNKRIGRGSTSNCYLVDGRALKLYIKTVDNQILKIKPDMLNHLNSFDGMIVDNVAIPEEILIDDNNNVLGFYMKYYSAKEFKKVKNNIIIKNMDKPIEKSMEVIEKLCEYNYRLCNLSTSNILYNDDFYFIDIDNGVFYNSDDKYTRINNYSNFNRIVTCGMFGLENDVELRFLEDELNNIYKEIINCHDMDKNIMLYKDFINNIRNIYKNDDISSRDLNKNKKRVLTTVPYKRY